MTISHSLVFSSLYESVVEYVSSGMSMSVSVLLKTNVDLWFVFVSHAFVTNTKFTSLNLKTIVSS